MDNIKYLHIMPNEKFINNFIKFINQNFNPQEHLFLIIGGVDTKKLPIIPEKNAVVYSKISKIKVIRILEIMAILLKFCLKAEKIYFHSLFDKSTILYLYLFSWTLKKSYWIIWGADLYCYKKRKLDSFKSRLWYRIVDFVKKNFYGYITEIPGDYELAQLWYGAHGKLYTELTYPSNLYKNINLPTKQYNDYLNVQIGNSADPSNNHMEILEKLSQQESKNFIIYCPLSYGNQTYADKIVKEGKRIFADRFIPLRNFLEYSKYLEFLSRVDIAIFAHDRQQAFGNIMSLLSMKKTVYLKETVTTYAMLKSIGIEVKSFKKLNELKVLSNEILEENKEIIKEKFSEYQLVKSWRRILEN